MGTATRLTDVPGRRAWAALALGGAGVTGALLLLARWPWFVETVYVGHLGPLLALGLSGVTGLLPFSVAEVGLVVLAAGTLWKAGSGLWGLRRSGEGSEASVPSASAVAGAGVGGLLRVAGAAALAAATFYLFWGLYYARADLVDRQGWRPHAAPVQSQSAAVEELSRLAAEAVTATNRAYVDAYGTEDLGVPSPVPDKSAMERAIEAGYRRLADHLNLGAAFARPRGPAKPLLSSRLMSHLGLVGIYAPWTAEANYNQLVPGHQISQSVAHEKAHQRGITGEDEANFIGYLATALSGDPAVAYSGLKFAESQLLRELQGMAPERTEGLLAQRLPGVQRDVTSARAYWKRFEGPPREAQQQFNDRYLRLHGVEEGIVAYARSVELLVIYSRVFGGSVVPRPSGLSGDA